MTEQFFEQPILNSPYKYPSHHWELDEDRKPTNRIIEKRRSAEFITPVPKPKKRKQSQSHQQARLMLDEGLGLSTAEQQYDPTPIINAIRDRVDRWRQIPNPAD
ncbi:MAG: restriction endonuclease [Chloroflexi bacterium AL-W]|nr:restriction endonuclease [Chloroflexi bacterium AL-N1]NOK69957.1 restriction endonuclease [Chloroflexi bacterium AL-N10]NOK73745.1 restriction endonuclease [Chloroflexi bacterium AL-N5]NOK85489.1 restriction endonuclease [Chloroflexi bacterium AL-W]NOK91690.1 restriction endonuclease [Chloroflexi bacterium AL-N15]